MDYPISDERFFLNPKIIHEGFMHHEKKIDESIISTLTGTVKKYQFLLSLLPCIEAIYICNSLSFKASHENSDIDLFIVTSSDRLWIARLRTTIILGLIHIRAIKEKKANKFCLSFYVTKECINLYHVSLKPYDLYLSYWIAHLVPIYHRDSLDIVGENQWIQSAIPDIKGSYIDLGIPVQHGTHRFKKIREKRYSGKRGDIQEFCIKHLRLPIMVNKYKRLGSPRGIIISDTMLKFHGKDVRKQVNYMFKIANK